MVTYSSSFALGYERGQSDSLYSAEDQILNAHFHCREHWLIQRLCGRSGLGVNLRTISSTQ
jgi:hypothetical protein